MTELLPLPAQDLPARVVTHVGEDLELADAPLRPELLEGIAENTAHASAAGTRRAYEGDWAAFERWCDVHGRRALPAQPQTVAGYITDRAALVEPGTGDHVYAPTTISRWVTSINVRHERENLAPPGATRTVKDTLAGIRRDNARPTRRMAPLLLNDLKRVLRGIDLHSYPDGIIGHRDAAILVMGFAGAYRRSELASRSLGDIALHPEDGLRVHLLTSKTDQEGRGSVTPLPFGENPLTCPVCWFFRWLRVTDAHDNGDRPTLMRVLRETDVESHICQGQTVRLLGETDPKQALFRPVRRGGHIGSTAISGAVVNAVVKRRLEAVGMDARRFGGHSLRAGFVTQSLRSGADPHKVMPQGRWRNLSTIEIYRRENDPLQGNSVTMIGL